MSERIKDITGLTKSELVRLLIDEQPVWNELRLRDPNIPPFRPDLSGVNLAGANLSGANLGSAILTGANLENADLKGARLVGANLRNASLRDANLKGADLDKTDLMDADLNDSNLEDVRNWKYAMFRDCNISGIKNAPDELEDFAMSRKAKRES